MSISNIQAALTEMRKGAVVDLNEDVAITALDKLVTAFAALEPSDDLRARARAEIRRALTDLGRESLLRSGMQAPPFGVWRLEQVFFSTLEHPASFDPENFTVDAMTAVLEDKREGIWWRRAEPLEDCYLVLARERGFRELAFIDGAIPADLHVAEFVEGDKHTPSNLPFPGGVWLQKMPPFNMAKRDERGFIAYDAAPGIAPSGRATLIETSELGESEVLDVITWGRMTLERYNFMRWDGVYLQIFALAYSPAFALDGVMSRLLP